MKLCCCTFEVKFQLTTENALISVSLVSQDDFILLHFHIGRLECESGYWWVYNNFHLVSTMSFCLLHLQYTYSNVGLLNVQMKR